MPELVRRGRAVLRRPHGARRSGRRVARIVHVPRHRAAAGIEGVDIHPGGPGEKRGEIRLGLVIEAFQQNGDKAVRLGTLVPGKDEAKVRYRGALKL